MGDEYKFRQVGTSRHPEIYTDGSDLLKPVVTDVNKELEMWKIAEAIVKLLNDNNSTEKEWCFIFHYVNAMMGLSEMDELSLMEYIRFRLFLARTVELLNNKEIKKSNFG